MDSPRQGTAPQVAVRLLQLLRAIVHNQRALGGDGRAFASRLIQMGLIAPVLEMLTPQQDYDILVASLLLLITLLETHTEPVQRACADYFLAAKFESTFVDLASILRPSMEAIDQVWCHNNAVNYA